MLQSSRLPILLFFGPVFVFLVMSRDNCVQGDDNPFRTVPGQTPLITMANLRLSDTGSVATQSSSPGIRVACIQGYGPAADLSQWLEAQPALEELSLICICLSDADVAAIRRQPKLSRLDLRGCQISDDQLCRLCSMTTLMEVDLRGTLVTAESLDELRKLSPQLTVQSDSR